MDPVTQTDPVPPVDPAVIASADPAGNAAMEPASPAGSEPSPAPADPAPRTDPAEPKPHGNKGKTPWYLSRISEESERARVAEERLRAAEELAQRLQRGEAAPATPPSAPVHNEADVEARAQQIVARQQIDGVISAGLNTFSDWDDRAAILGSAGAASPEFVMDVIAVDPVNAHKILHQLADDPAKAARLAKMAPRARTVELVKMSLVANPPAAAASEPRSAAPARTVSKAPPPPPAIEPGSAPAVDWRSDKSSDADFSKGWEENMRKRADRYRR